MWTERGRRVVNTNIIAIYYPWHTKHGDGEKWKESEFQCRISRWSSKSEGVDVVEVRGKVGTLERAGTCRRDK